MRLLFLPTVINSTWVLVNDLASSEVHTALVLEPEKGSVSGLHVS